MSFARSSSAVLVLASAIAFALLVFGVDSLQGGGLAGLTEWLGFGGNPNATSEATDETKISPTSVRERGLLVKWIYDTTDDAGCGGSLRTPPTIAGGVAYFTTATCYAAGEPQFGNYTGYLHAVDAGSGRRIWKRSLPSYAEGIPSVEFQQARVAPAIHRDLLLVGTQNHRARRESNPYAQDGDGNRTETMPELGAFVLAIDRHTGELVWATEVEEHPYASVTNSLTVSGDTVYVGTSGFEYFSPARDDLSFNADCCTHRGSLVALDVQTGSILWKTYMTPIKEEDKDGVPVNIDHRFYASVSIWGGPPLVDPERSLVYVATGNNSVAPREAALCERKRRSIREPLVYGPEVLPPEFSAFDRDYSLSPEEEIELADLLAERGVEVGEEVVCGAIDGEDETGKIRLNDAYAPTVNARGEKSFGNYPDSIVALHTEDDPGPGVEAGDVAWAFRSVEYDAFRFEPLPGPSPFPFGDDADFTNGPMLVATLSGQDLVVASTKEMRVFAIDPDTGAEVWSTRIGQRRRRSDWKPTSDGARVYATSANRLLGEVGVPGDPGADSFTNVFDFPENAEFVAQHFLCESGPDEKRLGCQPAPGTAASVLENGTVGPIRVALDSETGDVVWEAALDETGAFIDETGPGGVPDGVVDDQELHWTYSGLTLANGVLFGAVGDPEGTVQARDAATGEVIWSHEGRSSLVFTHPAVADGVVYWGSGYQQLPGLGNPDGEQLLAFEIPELCTIAPATSCIPAAKASLSIDERKPGKEKIKASLSKFSAATTPADFGDPVSGATVYDVCIYDAEGVLRAALGVPRAGETCGARAKPCWKATNKGPKYKDPEAKSRGVRKLAAKGGDVGKGKLSVQAGNKAKKGQSYQPPGLASALTGDASATLQVRTSDGSCFGATLTTVKRADGERFSGKTP